ncbi:MAG: HD domain-containing phosphohydrolase [Deltaproteobacteria bacterium]
MSTKNFSTLTRKYKTLVSALHSVYRLIHSSYELTDLVSKLTKLLAQIFRADSCTFILLDKPKKKQDRHTTVLRCCLTGNRRHISAKRALVKNKINRHIIATGAAVKKDALLAVPLISEDVTGTIVISRSRGCREKEGAFDTYDLEALMTIAGQIVIAVKNIELYEEQEKMVMGTIKSLVRVLDSRMPAGYTHTPYFSRLVTALAQELRLRKDEVMSLKYASMLHDAGKVNIPVEILTKATQLTGEEYNIIKHHPVKGAELFKHMDMLKPVIPIILHHHEKFDGTGYPSHLKKRQIPLGARIMAVADAFDAMVYGRPYKERIDPGQALDEIKKHSGGQFDPQIVKSLAHIFHNQKLKKYLNLKD